MPIVELVNGKKYVHMGMKKVFEKGHPREVTDEEADLLLSVTSKVRTSNNVLVEKCMFELKGDDLVHAHAANGDGVKPAMAEDAPVRRRGRPRIGDRPASVATVPEAMKASVAAKAAEDKVELEYVDEPAQPDN